MSSLGILSTQAAQARGQHSLAGWTEEGCCCWVSQSFIGIRDQCDKIEQGVKQNREEGDSKGKRKADWCEGDSKNN